MLITKKAIPRRTVLRGIGATLALPLLDAMVPPLTALQNTAAKTDHAVRRDVRPERHGDEAVDAGRRRRGLRVHADAERRSKPFRQTTCCVLQQSRLRARRRDARAARMRKRARGS